jgi:RNA polymerase sigma factor (sigma-70 family)
MTATDEGSEKSLSDALVLARQGDRRAENLLFERLRERVHALTRKRIWDPAIAEDLTQETMRTVCEKYREADLSSGLLPWVFTVLHHKIGNHLKRRRTEQGARDALTRDVSWDIAGFASVGETEGFDLADAIAKALRMASDDCRRVFTFLLRGDGVAEIREAFGNEPVGTTYSRVFRCREKLLRHLESLGVISR